MKGTVTYAGWIAGDEAVVQKDGEPLDLQRLTARMPNRAGRWEWGHPCDGAFQLAFALLLEATGSLTIATAWHIPYALEVVSQWPRWCAWSVEQEEVIGWLFGAMRDYRINGECPFDYEGDAHDFYTAPPEGGWDR